MMQQAVQDRRRQHLDHPFRDYLYPEAKRTTGGRDRAEVVADHFAACLLMPKKWIYSAWNEGIRDVSDLAYFFEVSPGYFTAAETPLLAGRDVSFNDTAKTPAVAVVNRTEWPCSTIFRPSPIAR